MRRKVANWLRRLADWLSPLSPATDALMPLARKLVAESDTMNQRGPIKWLLTMKVMERTTKAKRRHINAAIDRAVLERHGD